MARPTRKRSRSRRALATRRRQPRRHRGGSALTPFELLQQFKEAHDALDQHKNEDKVFEQVKAFYYDNIPQMSQNDWTHLITKTPVSPGSNSLPDPEEIMNRCKDVVNVLHFWIQYRKQKASGFRRFFNNGKLSDKLKASVKDAEKFIAMANVYVMGEVARNPGKLREYHTLFSPLIDTMIELGSKGQSTDFFKHGLPTLVERLR